MYYFISDTHLGMLGEQGDKSREKAVVEWLDSIAADAEAIFLLGDIFDFWFEYKRVVPKGFTRLLGKLSQLSDSGIRIHFFTGNHDMWTRDYLQQECGITVHTSPQTVTLTGKTLFLAHGDNMQIDGQPMLRLMNAVFRSRTVRWLFSHLLHPDAAMRFGQWWSSSSRKSKNIKEPFRGEDEPLVRYAKGMLLTRHIDYFVFGHIHCAEDFAVSADSRAIFLGEWIHSPAYAALDRDGNMTLHLLPQSR